MPRVGVKQKGTRQGAGSAVDKSSAKSSLHPNSRTFKQVARAVHRQARLTSKELDRMKKTEIGMGKVSWLMENMDAGDEERRVYTPLEMSRLVVRYMARIQDQIDELDEAQLSRGRKIVHNGRRDDLVRQQGYERKEYAGAGIELPDLTNGKVYKLIATAIDDEFDVGQLGKIVWRRFNAKMAAKFAAQAGEAVDEDGAMDDE